MYNSLLFSSLFWRILKSAAKILKINEIYKHFTLYVMTFAYFIQYLSLIRPM